VSDGGLLVALAEMAMASGIGARVAPPSSIALHAFWFGEDQARYVVTAPPSAAEAIEHEAREGGVPIYRLGATGGETLTAAGERSILVDELKRRFEAWLPEYMAGGPA